MKKVGVKKTIFVIVICYHTLHNEIFSKEDAIITLNSLLSFYSFSEAIITIDRF